MLRLACILGFVSGLAAMSPGARAANAGYCQHYASQAVWQFNRNRSIPGCFRGADGTWHGDYGRHYGWCVVAPYGAVREADAYRGSKLHECMFRAYGHY